MCYPCGNFSDTPSLKLIKTKGSIGHAFTVCIHAENQNQVSFYPFNNNNNNNNNNIHLYSAISV